jgi:hypothetical protein
MIADMPQSLSKVILHIIFSTRRIVNPGSILACGRACMLISEQSAATSAPCLRMSAVWLITFISSARYRELFPRPQLVQEIKKTSSKWIKALDATHRGFFWQRGYGAFSISPSQLEAVLRYITDQLEHHRRRTFQEEYRELLRKHGIDFDERYVWD